MEEGSEGSKLGLSLIKQLAFCNKTARERAVRTILKTWLPSQSSLPEEDMKKLWKGLFYCVWHADKVQFQSELINRLASILVKVDLSLSEQYLSAFFLTMRREWNGIDGLRLDKFYLLIRRFIHNFFLVLKRNSWDLELTKRLMGALEGSTFLANDKFPGNGVNYHIASVFTEELRPFLPLQIDVLELLFKPFIAVMKSLPDKVLLGKIKSNMFDVLLKMGKQLLEVSKSGGEVESGSDVMVFGTIGLVMGFSSKFYNLGSSPECCQGNRKALFDLHEMFLKLEKDLASSGLEFSIPDDNHDEEEVPTLVPISNEMLVDAPEGDSGQANAVANGVNGSAGNPSKKTKKDKKKAKKKKGEVLESSSEKNSTEPQSESEMVFGENGYSLNDGDANDENLEILNESVISNLQMQFEKIAAEAGLDDGVASACDVPEANEKVSKKRKRRKNLSGQQRRTPETNGEDAEVSTIAKSEERSQKKVRFSLKNNLVWKPQSPLPPESLRLPPSATPRGSALKKGVPPGPIREMLPTTKRVKLRKAKKAIKGIKRLKKLKYIST